MDPDREVDDSPIGAEDPSRRSRPIGLMICVAVLFVAMAFPLPELLDPAGGEVVDVSLELPLWYVLLSPITRILDQLTLLGVSQHVMVILTLLGLGAGLGARTARGSRLPVRLTRTVVGFVCGLAVALVVYAGMAYLPRPMPRLVVTDSDVVAVNFHGHSRYSHDVGDRYPVEWSLRWHQRAGYDAFVLSDHSSWTGVAEGEPLNPPTAGEGTLLLSGVEVWLTGEHIIALGDSARYTELLDPDRSDFEPDSAARLTEAPTFIVTIPGDPFRLPPLSDDDPMGVIAVEIHDGAPRGLEQARLQRDSIIGWARSNDLALVSGWNNHGAGQTPTAWTLLRIPGWQGLDATTLLASIEEVLHTDGFAATQVVERGAPSGTSTLALVLSVPMTLWYTLRVVTTPERMVWLLYLLGVWAVSSFSVRHRD